MEPEAPKKLCPSYTGHSEKEIRKTIRIFPIKKKIEENIETFGLHFPFNSSGAA